MTTRGTVLAFCEGRKAIASDNGDIALLLKRSTDDGQTRSPHKGRLIITCNHIEVATGLNYANIFYSDDHGESCKIGGRTPEGCQLCHFWYIPPLRLARIATRQQ